MIPQDHLTEHTDWETPPSCKCGQIADACRDQFVFASRFNEGGQTMLYMMPTGPDGKIAKPKGVTITFCPWCGDRIKAKRRLS